MSEHREPIPSMIYNAAVGGHVTNSQQIIDENENKEQSQINAEVKKSLGTGGSVDERIAEEGSKHYLKEETYNKSELNNMITTPNQEYMSFTATAETTAVTDILPDTGSADTTYRIGNWDGTQYNDSVFSEYAWNGSAYIKLSTKSQVGEIYDISANHANTKYANLAAALGTNGENIPQSLRKGGISIKFIQSSNNKYVQYRLMTDSFNTTIYNWQGVEDVPTNGSYNIVSSTGIALSIETAKAGIASNISPYYYNSSSDNYILSDSEKIYIKNNLRAALKDNIVYRVNENWDNIVFLGIFRWSGEANQYMADTETPDNYFYFAGNYLNNLVINVNGVDVFYGIDISSYIFSKEFSDLKNELVETFIEVALSVENGKYYAVKENKIISVNDAGSICAFADIPSNVYKVGITVDTPYGYGRCSAFVDSEGNVLKQLFYNNGYVFEDVPLGASRIYLSGGYSLRLVFVIGDYKTRTSYDEDNKLLFNNQYFHLNTCHVENRYISEHNTYLVGNGTSVVGPILLNAGDRVKVTSEASNIAIFSEIVEWGDNYQLEEHTYSNILLAPSQSVMQTYEYVAEKNIYIVVSCKTEEFNNIYIARAKENTNNQIVDNSGNELLELRTFAHKGIWYPDGRFISNINAAGSLAIVKLPEGAKTITLTLPGCERTYLDIYYYTSNPINGDVLFSSKSYRCPITDGVLKDSVPKGSRYVMCAIYDAYNSPVYDCQQTATLLIERSDTYINKYGKKVLDDTDIEQIYDNYNIINDNNYNNIRRELFLYPEDFEGDTMANKVANAVAFLNAAGGGYTLYFGKDASAENPIEYVINQAIVIPSNTTVYINNSIVRMDDDIIDNFFRTANIIPNPNDTGDYALNKYDCKTIRNVKILGNNGTIVMENNYQGTTGEALGWRGITFMLAYLENFEIAGLTISKNLFWNMPLFGCHYGSIHDIVFDLTRTNGDGIDICNGCHHINIYNISGTTYDDGIAFCANTLERLVLHPENIYPAICPFALDYYGYGKEIYDINIDNVSLGQYNPSGNYALINFVLSWIDVFNIRMSNLGTGNTARGSIIKIWAGYSGSYKDDCGHDIFITGVDASNINTSVISVVNGGLKQLHINAVNTNDNKIVNDNIDVSKSEIYLSNFTSHILSGVCSEANKTIVFTDVFGKTKTTTSDVDGNYSVSLISNLEYTISVDGYTVVQNSITITEDTIQNLSLI